MDAIFANYNFDGSPRDLNCPSESWKKSVPASGEGEGEESIVMWFQKFEHSFCEIYNSVKYAFRTVIMLQGTHSYMIVMDDIQAEDG